MHLLLKQQQGKMYVMYVDAALQNDLQLEMILNYFFFLGPNNYYSESNLAKIKIKNTTTVSKRNNYPKHLS